MWPIAASVVALVIIAITYWTYQWNNPKCKGKLPPGTMGLPLIGETIQFFIPGKTVEVGPFFKSRFKKYGPMFKTSLVGRKVVVTSDVEFSNYILLQEEKYVEFWYLDSFAKFFSQEGSVKDGTANINGLIHKYIRSFVGSQFGGDNLKDKIFPDLDETIKETLINWTKQDSVEVKRACVLMLFNIASKQMLSDDYMNVKDNLGEYFTNFLKGLMSLPLNIPGTTFHNCLQNQKKVLKVIRDIMDKRRALPPRARKGGDILDQMMDDMKDENVVTISDHFASCLMFGFLLASSETVTTTLTLALIMLTEHPLVLQELEKEHEEILRTRESATSAISWKEYKSMTFTMHVINEALRLTNVSIGFPRRVLKDINVNGFTIPEDWILMIVPAAIHMDPKTYKDPLSFNPWRWQEAEAANLASKNFMPFGKGTRSCTGTEFSKLAMAILLHHLVTKYRWTRVKGGEVFRGPVFGFGDGFHVKVEEK